MNDILAVMLDTAKLVTSGSDIARREVQRAVAERERRAAENAQDLALHPAAILAVGGTEQPVERLMGLRLAFAKAMQFVAAAQQVRLRLLQIGRPRYRLR